MGLMLQRLTHYNGSAAEVYLFGACVTSFTQPHGSEILYLRPDATFDGSKPIAYEPRFPPMPLRPPTLVQTHPQSAVTQGNNSFGKSCVEE